MCIIETLFFYHYVYNIVQQFSWDIMKHISKILFITVISLFFNQSIKAQWVKTNLPNGVNIWAMVVSGNNIFVGTGGDGIFQSSDNGTTWNAVNNGLRVKRVWSLAASGENIYAGTGDIDDGMGSNGFVYLSTDTGANWKALNNGLYNCTISSIAVNENYIFAAAEGYGILGIFASTNYGASWNEADSGLTYRAVYSLIINGNNIFAGTRSGVFLSTNNAANWEKVNHGMTDSSIQSLYADGNNIYAGTYNGVFLLSTNSGQLWRTLGGSLTDIKSILVINNGNDIIVGTWGNGVFLLTAADTNWKAINDGLASTYSPYISSIVVKDNDIYIGTQDGVWKRPLKEVITSIDNVKNIKPDQFELSQNYPNPFNPSTKIKYSIAKEGRVKLTIYNSIGRKVATLVDQNKPAGNYSVQFNKSNFASGIYLYRLESGNYSYVKKFMLIK
jgi:photosystem II stability/assembly factor-like uncharacterized protein